MDTEDILQNTYRDTRICSECVEEPDLQAYVAGADGEHGCSFCEDDDSPTCGFLEFMDHVKTCIEAEYDLAVNCLPWESREGGWLWEEVWDTYELLTDEAGIGFPRDNGNLLEAMVEYMGGNQDWCVRNPYGEDALAVLRIGWKRFCDLVQHHTRFFLDRWTSPVRHQLNADPYPTPAEVLHAIGDRIARLELCRNFPAGTTIFYRVRYCKDGRQLRTPVELGPPPINEAIVSNRMSPPGIVMFYAALDSETALAETVKDQGRYAIGAFRICRPVRLLDLAQVPELPGLFARTPDSRPWAWRDAQFFHDLVADFTRPIERDDRVHVEYIPTQVVTEYCRLVFHHEHNTAPLDGILYPSARNPGYAAVVLFADHTAVVRIEPAAAGEANRTWLDLIYVEHRDLTTNDIDQLKSHENRNLDNTYLSF